MLVRREYSVPERLSLFGLACAAVGLIYPALTDRTGLGLPCPLRTLTGIPCPFCGLTTATVALVGGDLPAAVATNPFVLPLAVLVLSAIPVLVARLAGRAAPPKPWSPAARRRVGWLGGALAGASWIFQLHRFGWL